MTIPQRVSAALRGAPRDRHPFVVRLEVWRRGLAYSGTLPPELKEMSLPEIHRRTGIGAQVFASPVQWKLRGVELRVMDNGVSCPAEIEPVVSRFPDVGRRGLPERPGRTQVEFVTPVGSLSIEYTQLDSLLRAGASPYMSKHPMASEADFRIVRYIVERMEVVAVPEAVHRAAEEYGPHGYVIPLLPRIPFQQMLIDFFSTDQVFFALQDYPRDFTDLVGLLDEKMTEVVKTVAGMPFEYVEFGDNLDGMMTNPRLFQEYCHPAYRKYTDILHDSGKRVGSHTDGQLIPLLAPLAKCGLDVCESVSPFPLTPMTLDAALDAWQEGPMIWGAIPGPILESRTPEVEFDQYLERTLAAAGHRPIVFAVVDQALPIHDLERIRTVASRIEGFSFA